MNSRSCGPGNCKTAIRDEVSLLLLPKTEDSEAREAVKIKNVVYMGKVVVSVK